jgi:hypothetical protein
MIARKPDDVKRQYQTYYVPIASSKNKLIEREMLSKSQMKTGGFDVSGDADIDWVILIPSLTRWSPIPKARNITRQTSNAGYWNQVFRWHTPSCRASIAVRQLIPKALIRQPCSSIH